MRSDSKREETKTKLMEEYFDETLHPNSKVAEELLDSILRIYCQETKSAREPVDHLRERAKSPKDSERGKATLLLKKTVGYLPH